MNSSDEVINLFVRNFVQKDKRERCLLLLKNVKKRRKFTDELNHHWGRLFDMSVLTQLGKHQDNYEAVQRLLGIKDHEPSYVISDEEFDDIFLPFNEAFEKANWASFGTLLINMTANRLFLKTEDVRGGTPRFIGVK